MEGKNTEWTLRRRTEIVQVGEFRDHVVILISTLLMALLKQLKLVVYPNVSYIISGWVYLKQHHHQDEALEKKHILEDLGAAQSMQGPSLNLKFIGLSYDSCHWRPF